MHEDGYTAGFVGEGGMLTGVQARACLGIYIRLFGGERIA